MIRFINKLEMANRTIFTLITAVMIICFSPVLNAQGLSPDHILTELFSGDKDRANSILVNISRNKPADFLKQLKSVLLSSREAHEKEMALKAFIYYPYKMTIDPCLEILKKSPSFLVKKGIIDYLAGAHDRRTVMTIADELDSPFYAVRESSILALKAIGDDRMYPHILNMMESETPILKVYALEALFHIYDMRFYGLLIHMLKEENKSIRYYTLKCIEKNELQNALSYVRRSALKDADREVRVRAIQVLGNLRDHNSLYTLLTCLIDENRDIRYASAKSLHILKFRKSAYALSEQLYKEGEDEIKRTIIDTLILLGNSGGHKGLRKMLMEDKNVRLRIRSAFALGANYSPAAVPVLLGGLKDSEAKVRAEVCNSLGNYRTKNSINALLSIINDDSDRYVRTAAVYSIKRINKGYVAKQLFDRYTIEEDPIIREKLRFVIRGFF